MARPPHSRKQRRATDPLQETGIQVALLGFAFLLGPLLLGSSVVGKVLGAALSLPGWFLLAAGALTLGVAYLRKNGGPTVAATYQSPAVAAWELTNHEKQDLMATLRQPAQRKTAAHVEPQFSPAPRQAPDIQFGRKTRKATAEAAPRSPSDQSEWSADVFAAIEWRRFEAVCEALFAQAGFRTESQSHGADGGVDIWLYSANAVGPAAIAQCKHWTKKPVGVKDVREFFGVMASHQLKRGTYATTSSYTEDAMKFAKANGINAMDGAALLKLIASRTPEQQTALLTVAFEGDYWRPTCASCGIKTVSRKPAKGGAAFWGCTHFPRCKTTFKMTEST
jgi:restriction system protein